MFVAATGEPSFSRVPPVQTIGCLRSSRMSRTRDHKSGSIFIFVPIGQNLQAFAEAGLPRGMPAFSNAAAMSFTLSSVRNIDS